LILIFIDECGGVVGAKKLRLAIAVDSSDLSRAEVYRRVEVLAGAGRRRQWLREAKALIVLQAMQPAIPRWTVRLAMPISSTPHAVHAAIGPATQSLTVNEAQREAIARGIRDADTRPTAPSSTSPWPSISWLILR